MENGNDRTTPDYPYYDGEPVSLSWLDWIIVLAALAIGFAALGHAVPGMVNLMGRLAYAFLAAILFGAIPLAALFWRSKGHIDVLFNGWKWSYLGWGIAFGILNLIFTFCFGSLANALLDLAPNERIAGLAQGAPTGGYLYFYAKTGIQLFGEEVLTIIPFLFLLWLGVTRLGWSRKASVILAYIGSAVIFGAAHLPTYDWNVPQALLLIGPIRLVLTLAYIKTKSMWTCTIAHVLNDWTLFTVSTVLGSMAAASN